MAGSADRSATRSPRRRPGRSPVPSPAAGRGRARSGGGPRYSKKRRSSKHKARPAAPAQRGTGSGP
eukprot:7614364-Alexandrium_andersonii.AAC.1